MIKKSLTIGIILMFLFCNISFTTLSDDNSSNLGVKTLYVGGSGEGNYTRIQDAIDNASDGDTVFVYNGTYYENIILDKVINLIGENSSTTIIDGKRLGDAVKITADGVTIMSFTARNGEESTYYTGAGIKVYNVDKIEIYCCNASSNINGIYVYNSSNNTLINNVVASNSRGIFLCSSSNTIIAKNTVLRSNHNGILIEDSDNISIENNTVSNNSRGIELEHTNYSTITNNTVSIVGGPGIGLWFGSSHNIISENEVDNCDGDGIELVEGSYNTIFANNIKGCGLGLECYIINNGYTNRFNYNNFIDSEFAHVVVFSPFPSLRKNNFNSNYWDNWPGIIPKPIFGKRRGAYFIIPILGIVTFDWCPLISPYNG